MNGAFSLELGPPDVWGVPQTSEADQTHRPSAAHKRRSATEPLRRHGNNNSKSRLKCGVGRWWRSALEGWRQCAEYGQPPLSEGAFRDRVGGYIRRIAGSSTP